MSNTIDTATGNDLDAFGSLLGIHRRRYSGGYGQTAETDDSFRKRLLDHALGNISRSVSAYITIPYSDLQNTIPGTTVPDDKVRWQEMISEKTPKTSGKLTDNSGPNTEGNQNK